MQSVQPKYGYGMTLSACLWLGLFPLLQGGTYATLTHDKWVIMLALTAATLLCFVFDLFLRFRGKARRLHAGPPGDVMPRRGILPFVSASALILWTVLSCLFSAFGRETWWLGESVRYEGLATQLCYFALFACFFFSRVNLKPVLLSAAAGVALFFVVVLLQRGGANPLGLFPPGRSYALNPEFQGTVGNVDMGTGYLLLLAGLFLYALLNLFPPVRPSPSGASGSSRGAHIAWAVVLFSALPVTVFLIVTMDVQFGAVTLAALFLVTLFRFLPKKLRLPLLILLVVLALLLVWFWPGQGGGLWELHEILRGRGRPSFGSNRVAVWDYSLRLAGENPLLGGGSGTFRIRFNQYLEENGLVIPEEQDGVLLPHYFDNPHNEYIARLTDNGLPAMLLFAALVLAAVFRRRDRLLPLLSPCGAAVFCYAVQAFFSFSVCIVAPLFWVLLGLSFREAPEG